MHIQRFQMPVEFKFSGDAAAMEFSGYGAAFGNVDSYGDVIAPGAFAETLREAKSSGQWPAMLLQHGAMNVTAEDMTPVGIWTAMEEDNRGLKLEGKLADTARGRDLYTLMKMQPRSAINGLSVGYSVKSYHARTKPEEPRRTLTALKLWEVSPVTFPANDKARVLDVKSAAPSEIERALRDAGFSRSDALAFMSKGINGLHRPREAGDHTELAALIERNISHLK